MMRVWLRDAKEQSEELKALFEQSRIVATESAGIAKCYYEKNKQALRSARASMIQRVPTSRMLRRSPRVRIRLCARVCEGLIFGFIDDCLYYLKQ